MSVQSKMTAIADAIRAKRGIANALTLDQMATEIGSIQTGIMPTGTKSITANGTYDVTQFAGAEVDVPSAPGYYVKTGTFTTQSSYGYSATITHNLGKEKLLVMMQARGGATFSSGNCFIAGFWLSNELKSAYMTERKYTLRLSQGQTSKTIPIAIIGGKGLNTPTTLSAGLIATPNAAIDSNSSAAAAMKTATSDNNSLTVYSTCVFKSGLTYDWTVIAFD